MKLKGSLAQAGQTIVLNDGATTQATITTSNAASATFTLPAATDTIVGRASTDTLTNKTLTSPTLTTPALGVATATSINKVAITAPATSATLTIADGKTLTCSNTLTFTGTDTSSVAFGTGGTVAYTANKLSVFAATSSSELAGVISDETGSGALVFGTSPALTTPAIGSAGATYAGSSSGTTTLKAAATASGTLTLPAATDTLVGLATTDTLTNKTLTSPKLNENVAVTTTATKLNYLTSAAGTTGTASTNIVFSTSPTLTTPVLGVATATSINKMAITAPATSSTLAVADGKTLTCSNTLTFTGTDTSSVAFGAGGTVAYTGNDLSVFASTTSLQLKTLLSDETGSGAAVFATSPTLVTPVLGTPSSGTLTSCTGLPLTSGVTGTLGAANGGTGVANNAASTLTISGNFGTTLTVSNTTSVTLPTSGTLSTLAGAEVITNKDHDGGTASNTSRLTVPKAATSTLTGLTRKQGTLVYDTTVNALFSDDGSNLNPVGSGAGEKNYIVGTSTAAGWTASGGGITVATDTTAADLPRPNTSKSGILLTGVSGSSAYAYYRFILDDADANKKLKVQFDMKPGTAVASDFKVDVYSNTANDYSTGNTRLALSTDSSAVSALPALTGTYRTTFDAPAVSAKYIELRIGMNATQTHTLVISDVIVGPGVVTQGAAVSGWTTYTPTVANLTLDSTGKVDPNGIWRREGDSMRVRVSWLNGSGGAATGASAITISMPTGYTVNTAALPTAVGNDVTIGHAMTYKASLASNYDRSVPIVYHGGSIFVVKPGTAGNLVGTDFAASAEFSAEFFVPINEWAGNGTVNVVQNDAEYVSNSGSSTSADDLTSFAYGPAGSATIAYTTGGAAQFQRRVRFNTPVQATDRLFLEVQKTSGGMWMDVTNAAYDAGVSPLTYQIGVVYGAGFRDTLTGSTDVTVVFGKYMYASGATYGAAGTAWVSTYSWRVRKSSGGQAVGFSNVAQNAAGLVKSAGQLLGTNTNDTAATGYVGEFISANPGGTVAPAATTSYVTITSISLTAGDWDVQGTAVLLPSTLTSCTWISAAISLTNNATDSLGVGGVSQFNPITTTVNNFIPTGTRRVSVSTTTTVYLVGAINYASDTGTNWTTSSFISARRVR